MGTPPFPPVQSSAVVAELRVAFAIDALAAEPLAKAFGHQSFLVDAADNRRYLVKIAREAPEVERLQATAAATASAIAGGVPVPAVLGVVPASVRFGGRPYLVQEFLAGVDAEEVYPSLEAAERSAFWAAVGRAAARLHCIGADGFTEAVIPPEDNADWAAHVRVRAGKLAKYNRRAGVIDEVEIRLATERLAELAAAVSSVVEPALAHRDLLPRNALVHEGKFRCLLDFEHARYTDAVMDFAKLHLHVFEVFEGAQEDFMRGYRVVLPQPYPLFDDRLELAIGLELLGGIPYFKRNALEAQLADYVGRLRRWLAKS